MKEIKEKAKEKYPPGHLMSIWVALGIPIGLAIGSAFGNTAIGPAIGALLGAGIGVSAEAKAKEEGRIREFTEEEKACNKSKMWIVLLIGVLILLGALFLYFRS